MKNIKKKSKKIAPSKNIKVKKLLNKIKKKSAKNKKVKKILNKKKKKIPR